MSTTTETTTNSDSETEDDDIDLCERHKTFLEIARTSGNGVTNVSNDATVFLVAALTSVAKRFMEESVDAMKRAQTSSENVVIDADVIGAFRSGPCLRHVSAMMRSETDIETFDARYFVIPVRGDGRCLFTSLALGMELDRAYTYCSYALDHDEFESLAKSDRDALSGHDERFIHLGMYIRAQIVRWFLDGEDEDVTDIGMTRGQLLDMFTGESTRASRRTYLEKMANAFEWGQQPELLGFARAFKTNLDVYQIDDRDVLTHDETHDIERGMTPLSRQPRLVRVDGADASLPTSASRISLLYRGDGARLGHYVCLVPARVYWTVRSVSALSCVKIQSLSRYVKLSTI